MLSLILLALIALFDSVSDPRLLLKQATEEQVEGRLAEAVRDYRTLIRDYPNIAELHSNLGAALAAQGDYSGAIAEYIRALEIKRTPQMSLNLALAYYKSGDLESATSTLTEIHRAIPENQQALLLLSDCYFRLGRYGDVIAILTPAQEAHPDEKAYRYLLGTALIRTNQVTKGQVIIDSLLRNGDSAEVHLLIGMTKMNARDFSAAVEDFKRAVDLNPTLADVYSYYGQALLATGDPTGASVAFRKELVSNPLDFESNIQYGALLRQDGKLDEARQCFARALQTRPGNLAVRYQLAMIAMSESRPDDCRQQLEAITKEAPNFTEAHVSLATVYYRLKRKADGDRERAIVQQLNAAEQDRQPAAVK